MNRTLARAAARGAVWNFLTVLAERGFGFLVLGVMLRHIPLASVGVVALGSAISDLVRMLVAGGAVTALPLTGFAYGARRISYSLVGIVQYVGPTLQLLTGVFLFGEAFTRTQAVGFGLIWGALAIYATDGLWRSRAARVASVVVVPATAE